MLGCIQILILAKLLYYIKIIIHQLVDFSLIKVGLISISAVSF